MSNEQKSDQAIGEPFAIRMFTHSKGEIQMNRKFTSILVLLIPALVALACGKSPTPTDTPVPTNTPAPTSTLVPTDTPAPTNTPVPTDTPAPTNTPRPTPTPEITLGEEIRSKEGGYAFRAIPGYEVETALGLSHMLAPGADPDNGPLIFMAGAVKAENEAFTLKELFAAYTAELEDKGIKISNQREIAVGGAPGLTADISGAGKGDAEITGRVVVVVPAATRDLYIVGAAPTQRWNDELAPLFDAVVASVTFFEPVAAVEEVEIRQWAASATASSEYGNPNWSAGQATGAPDTSKCGDITTAWAAAGSDTVEWLELRYDVPVRPTEVNIFQTYNPDQVVKVEMLDVEGTYHQVYTGEPEDKGNECPYTLSIPVEADYQAIGVKITLDQSVFGSWNEIDAVELVGFSGGEALAPTPAPTPEEATPVKPPAGFLWRIGGENALEGRSFAHLGGMDVGRNDFLYVADNINGVLIFNADGNLVERIDHDEFNNVTDVSIGWSGNIYAASWGNNSVFVLDVNGEILTQIGGEEGTGPGQFGKFSPQAVTVDLDENIYVLDENEDTDGEKFVRVQVFDRQGNYLFEFPITEDFFGATDIEFNPVTDHLYVLGFLGNYMLEYDLEGNLIGRFAEGVVGSSQRVDVDIKGNFYVSTWTEHPVLKLGPEGSLATEFGQEVELSGGSYPEGAFAQPGGIAVARDGYPIYVTDWSGEYSYITAFEFK